MGVGDNKLRWPSARLCLHSACERVRGGVKGCTSIPPLFSKDGSLSFPVKTALTFNYFPRMVRDDSIGVTNSQGRTQNTSHLWKKVEWWCNLAHAHFGCHLVNFYPTISIFVTPPVTPAWIHHAPIRSSRPRLEKKLTGGATLLRPILRAAM